MMNQNVQKIYDCCEFSPSPKILPRIISVLYERGSIGRTNLATAVNTNYPILAKQLVWLEMNEYIEFQIEKRKMVVKLTEKGREFALILSNFPY